MKPMWNPDGSTSMNQNSSSAQLDKVAIGRLELSLSTITPSQARHYIAELLTIWEMSKSVINVAELVISEIITEELGSTGGELVCSQVESGEQRVVLVLRRLLKSITLELFNRNACWSESEPFNYFKMREVKLRKAILDATCNNYGYHYPRTGGVVVWAEISQ